MSSQTVFNIAPLLNARSIAVVGASDKPGSFGAQVLNNLIEFGYEGDVYGVHPRLTELFGKSCYPSLSALPQPPDCVALAVANHHLLGLLEEAADAGVPSAVVFGDPNVGVGRAPELQDAISQLAQTRQIAVCGPNAMGVYALHHRLVISGYPVRATLRTGNIALITHSGTDGPSTEVVACYLDNCTQSGWLCIRPKTRGAPPDPYCCP